MFDRIKYKQFALIQLNKRLKIPFLMVLITIVISEAFNLFDNFLPDITKDLSNNTVDFENFQKYFISIIVKTGILFLTIIVMSILQFASNKVYLKMSKSPEPVFFNDFTDGLKDWKKAVRTGLWTFLWLFIWGLIAIPVMIIFSILISIISIVLGTSELITILIPIGVLISLAGFIPMFIKSLSYSMAIYLAGEYNKIGAIKALTLSKKITENHKMDLFVLSLSFLGWILLCVLTFGIASLWVNPYISLTQVNAYHALLKEAVDSGKVSLSDLGISDEEKPVYLTDKTNQQNEEENL